MKTRVIPTLVRTDGRTGGLKKPVVITEPRARYQYITEHVRYTRWWSHTNFRFQFQVECTVVGCTFLYSSKKKKNRGRRV